MRRTPSLTLLAAAVALALGGTAWSAPTADILTKPKYHTNDTKRLIHWQTTAPRAATLAQRVLTAVRRDVAGMGDGGDPSVTNSWQVPPRRGAPQAMAVIVVRGIADDSVVGSKLTVVLRRYAGGWRLVAARSQAICSRGVTSDRRLCT